MDSSRMRTTRLLTIFQSIHRGLHAPWHCWEGRTPCGQNDTQVCENSTFPQLRWRTVIMKTIHPWKNSEVFNYGGRRHNSSFIGVTSKVDLCLSFSMDKNQHFFLPYLKPYTSFLEKMGLQITLFPVTSKAPKQGCNFHSFIFYTHCKRFG